MIGKDIEEALRKGIEIKVGESWVKAPGIVALVFVPQANKFALAFGTSQTNASAVPVDEQGKTWRIAK